MDTTRPTTSGKGIGVRVAVLGQSAEEVGSTTLAKQVCVVCWWADRNGLGGAVEEVAQVVGELLHLIGLKGDVVLDDDVMSWACCSLKTLVSLKVELAQDLVGDAAVDDGSWKRVPGSLVSLRVVIRILHLGRVEASVVALADDDDGNLGMLCLCTIHLVKGFLKAWQLRMQDSLVLAFRNSIAVHDNLRWKTLLILLLPQLKALHHHFLQSINHLLLSRLGANAARPLNICGSTEATRQAMLGAPSALPGDG